MNFLPLRIKTKKLVLVNNILRLMDNNMINSNFHTEFSWIPIIAELLLRLQYEISTVLMLPIHTLTIYYCFAGSNFRLNAFIIGTYPE